MVVLAASLVTKSGKALVSRQFVEMSRIRIEGLLAAFPKLVGIGKQHTYVETETVRYVYQPMEGLYLVLVTNKSSNILEDLETLRLLSKTVPEYIHSLDEDSVTRGAFELIFAFDEVISMGHKENITVQQIRQNTDMESHEEKLHKMIIQSKINDTKDVMKRKAMEIDKHKLEQRAREVKAGFSSMPKTISGMGGSIGSDMDMGPTLMRPDPTPASRAPNPTSRPMGGKGMQLGKGKKTNTLIDSLKAEGEVIEADPVVPVASSKAMPVAPPPTDPITISVEEKLVVLLNKDGGLESMEVQGTMSLQVLTEDDAYLHVALDTGDVDRFQFKTHPNIDKQLYANDQVLGLRDPERPFPTGSALGILKWRFNTTDESLVPLLINCWPSVSGGESYVNIEYESQAAFDLQNVEIAIPLPAMSHAPQANQVDGQWRYEPRRSALLWTIDIIDKTNTSGSMEFVVPACDPATFFPVEVQFTANKTLCDVRVASVTNLTNNAPAKFAGRTLMATEEYQVA